MGRKQDIKDLIEVVYLISDSHNLLYDGGWASQPYFVAEAYQLYKSELIRWQSAS